MTNRAINADGRQCWYVYAANHELRWSEPKEPDEIANGVDQSLVDYPAKIKG